MITMSTKLRPSLFGVILLVLSIILLINTVWEVKHFAKLEVENARLRTQLAFRMSLPRQTHP